MSVRSGAFMDFRSLPEGRLVLDQDGPVGDGGAPRKTGQSGGEDGGDSHCGAGRARGSPVLLLVP